MDASPCHLPWQHVRVMLKDRHKNDWRHLPLAFLQLFSQRFLVGRRLGVLDIQLQTFHDRPTQMTLELVPVNVMAQLLNQDPFSYSDLVPALGRGRHPLELIPVNLMEQLLNNVLDSDDSVLTPHHEPCQQSRDSPDLEPVDVMEKFLNC